MILDHLAGKRYLWFTLSLIVIIPGLLSLIFFGLRLGIDFTGGTQWQLQFTKPVQTEPVKRVLASHGFSDTVVQNISLGGKPHVVQITMKELKQGSPVKDAIKSDLDRTIGPSTELSFDTVGASVGSTIRNRAVVAVILASIGILFYIAYAFRNTQNLWLYGICALVAMMHDVLVVLGIFSILGVLFKVQIDALFVTALLTVIGFSVHDTIVVFDRIRENLARRVSPSFEDVVNYSLAQTLVRSLNTSMTVVFTLLALYLFGGSSTQEFVLALLIGVISGTYSSIFNASQLLVAWENGEIQHFWSRITRRGPGAAAAASR